MKQNLPIFALVIAVVALVIFLKFALGRMSRASYKALPIMTPNEIEFFNRLQRVLPEMYIFPQVAMSALIAPDLPRKSRNYFAAFGRIAQKRVDYVVCKKDLAMVCVVELDDRTHDSDKDKQRDAFTASAGLKTIRWHSKNKPKDTDIRDAIDRIAQPGQLATN